MSIPSHFCSFKHRNLFAKNLRKTVIVQMANTTLKSVKNVCRLETYADDFSKKVGNYVRFSEEIKREYRNIYVNVNKVTDKIRKKTNTQASLRDASPDSDDSGTTKGEKSITLQVLMGDEVENVLHSSVLLNVQYQHERELFVTTLLHELDIGHRLLRQWGYTLQD